MNTNKTKNDNIILSINGLSIGYNRQPVCPNITCDIYYGEMVALIGRNGCGKSTFLKTLVGILPPIAGNISYSSQVMLSKLVSVVFTRFDTFTHTTIHDIIAMGRIPYLSLFNHLTKNDEEMIENAFKMVHLDDSVSLYGDFNALSDGQKQKVLIAKAIAQQTPVILLDEPTSHLDIPSRIEVLNILSELVKSGHTILISTHELDLIANYAHRFLMFTYHEVAMYDIGQIKNQNLIKEMFA